MIIKSIRLKDFRQFKGEQDPILFSTDKDKNVTIIMGTNGSGKTTLAQAFTWCLYGDVNFTDKNIFCNATKDEMLINKWKDVEVEINLIYRDTEYIIKRTQRYEKNNLGIKTQGKSQLSISKKVDAGEIDFINEDDVENTINEILPETLSKYFLFDGERIETMSQNIRKGKGDEFSKAVHSLLGLNVYEAAFNHLQDDRNSVIKTYNKEFDIIGDSNIRDYSREIDIKSKSLAKIEERFIEIEKEKEFIQEENIKLEEIIKKYADPQKNAERKIKEERKLKELEGSKQENIKSALRIFHNRYHGFFAESLINKCVGSLQSADKLDKGVPHIHKKTIEYLINRGTCICGCEIEKDNEVYENLQELLKYIPPQSVGTIINQFKEACNHKMENGKNLFEDFETYYSNIRSSEKSIDEKQNLINNLDKRIGNLPKIADYNKKLNENKAKLRSLDSENNLKNQEKGRITRELSLAESNLTELNLKSENNKRIEIYKIYAEAVYNKFKNSYNVKEKEMRKNLKETINNLFNNMYDGGLFLEIDDKYNIQVRTSDYKGYVNDIDTSQAQSIIVILAFITGVITLAKENQNSKEDATEPYPLIMDAPLSAFDTHRIKNVCNALPEIAEQVIIFIKDTDGEIAEKNMMSKIGKRYIFEKKDEFTTYVNER